MPRYDYRCEGCGEQFEVVQSFNESALTTCPHCHTEGLRKVFNSVGVVFKGSGFYRNDSRESGKKTPAATTAASTPSADSAAKPAAAKDSGGKSATPATTKAATPSGK